MEITKNYIDGSWVTSASGRLLDIEDPGTGKGIGHVPVSTRDEVDSAVRSATKAFAEWKRVPPTERVSYLFKLKMLLQEHLEDIATTTTREHGKTVEEARGDTRRLLENVDAVKALIHVTGDGFLNLLRVKSPVGFEITDLPDPPVIFELIREAGGVDKGEMFRVFNMGVGFAAVVGEEAADSALETLQAAGAADAQIIGHVRGTEAGRVSIPSRGLLGTRKEGFVEVD